MRLEEFDECFEDVSHILFKEEINEHRVWLEDKGIFFPNINVNIKYGIFENWDDNSKEYEISHTFYMFFDEASGDYLYDETGSSLAVCISNFLHFVKGISLSMDDILNLDYEIK